MFNINVDQRIRVRLRYGTTTFVLMRFDSGEQRCSLSILVPSKAVTVVAVEASASVVCCLLPH